MLGWFGFFTALRGFFTALRGFFTPLRGFFTRLRVEAGKSLELRLHFTALLFLALDIDAPAGELGGEPDVLPLLADRERQLLVLDDHFHHALAIVHDRHALHLRRAQRVGDER